MRVALTVLGIGLLSLCGILTARTLLHQPKALNTIEVVKIDLDEQTVGQHLSEAIGLRTVSHQNQEDIQTSEFEAFINWVRKTYPEVDQTMQSKRLGGFTLLYRWQGSNPELQPILLTGHYDVVPVIPGSEDQWQHPPYSGRIENGIIWGRGALDDKSAVIAQLEAATHLLKSGFTPKRTVYFSFGHDEEIGGKNGAAQVAAHLAQQNVQLAWSLDEGSFLFNGILPGIQQQVAAINVAEKGSATLNIVAKSAGGHSSMPPQRTAVGSLAAAITALESNPIPGGLTGLSEQMFDTASRYMPFGTRLFFANRWLFGPVVEAQLSAVTFGNAMLRTTTAPTMLSGSIKTNILPIEAVATVNFRLHPRDSVEDLVKYVESVVAADNIEVHLWADTSRGASPVSSWEASGYQTVEQSIREIYGDVVVTPGLMIAASDSRHYGTVADDAYRFNPFTVSQADMTGFHGTNEKISLESLVQGTRTYVRILQLGSVE